MTNDLLTHMMVALRKARVLDLEGEVLEVWLDSYAEHRKATGTLKNKQDPEYTIGMSQRIQYCEDRCKTYMESQI